MFFSLEPEKYFPYAQIDVVQFPDGLGGDRIIEKIFKGPLHQQLREALLYIKNVALEEMILKLPDVAEARRNFNYPYAAIEEALSNAVYHKGYDVREPIEVRILPDKIEILSHPGADRSISLEGLKNYRATSRRYRNRRIGEFLKELHLTEGRNTGFQKILRALELNGSPKPLFETDDERTFFMTTIFIHPDFAAKRAHTITNVSGIEPHILRDGSNWYTYGVNYGVNCGVNCGVNSEIGKLTEKEGMVLNFVIMYPTATVKEISTRLSIGKTTVDRALQSLKEKQSKVNIAWPH